MLEFGCIVYFIGLVTSKPDSRCSCVSQPGASRFVDRPLPSIHCIHLASEPSACSGHLSVRRCCNRRIYRSIVCAANPENRISELERNLPCAIYWRFLLRRPIHRRNAPIGPMGWRNDPSTHNGQRTNHQCIVSGRYGRPRSSLAASLCISTSLHTVVVCSRGFNGNLVV